MKLLSRAFELTPKGRCLMWGVVGCYLCLICGMCFTPQHLLPQYKDVMTPGIIQWGRVYLLLVPFNSLVNSGQIDSLTDFLLILLQNVANVLLLTPLVLGLLFLFPKWRSKKKVFFYSFCMSLGIELTQVILDLLIDAGRVFELDDLWTNALGGLVAYGLYQLIRNGFKRQKPL